MTLKKLAGEKKRVNIYIGQYYGLDLRIECVLSKN